MMAPKSKGARSVLQPLRFTSLPTWGPAFGVERRAQIQVLSLRQTQKNPLAGAFLCLAEREGFEPSIRLLTLYSLSRGAPSASRASLREHGPSGVWPERAAKDTGLGSVRQPSVTLADLAVGRIVLVLDALVNLLAVYRDILRSIDANAHLIALHTENGDGHLVADHQGFTDPAGQNQHDSYSIYSGHWPATGRRLTPRSSLDGSTYRPGQG